jgi:hypothetical protein
MSLPPIYGGQLATIQLNKKSKNQIQNIGEPNPIVLQENTLPFLESHTPNLTEKAEC